MVQASIHWQASRRTDHQTNTKLTKTKFDLKQVLNVIYRLYIQYISIKCNHNTHMMSHTKRPKQTKYQDLDPLIIDLVAARKAQKLTQQGLADMAGLARRTIVLVESGGDCTLGTLRRLAIALGLQMRSQQATFAHTR